MAIFITSNSVSKAVSSKYENYLLPRKEVDRLNDALDSNEYMIFELDNPSDKSILEYLYIMTKSKYCVNPKNPEIYHRVMVTTGAHNADSLNIALTAASTMIEKDDFYKNDWTFEIMSIDKADEADKLRLYQIYASIVVCSVYTNRRPVVCVPDTFEVPYILQYLADVRVFTKDNWDKLVSEVKSTTSEE